MHTYRVGERYHPQVEAWPEGVHFCPRWELTSQAETSEQDDQRQTTEIVAEAYDLLLFLPDPTKREIAYIRRGPAHFALSVIQPRSENSYPLVFFLFAFPPVISWSDAPTSIHLMPRWNHLIRTSPQFPQASASPWLSIFLVNSTDGNIAAMRQVSLPPRFTMILRQALLAQLSAPWPGDVAYDKLLAEVTSSMTATDLLRHAQARMDLT